MSSSELQNDDYLLPGGIGTININGQDREIIKTVSDYRNGSLTLTLAGTKPQPLMIDGNKTGLMFYLPEQKIQLPDHEQ